MIVNHALIQGAGYTLARRTGVEATSIREPPPGEWREHLPVAQVIEGDWLGSGRMHEYAPRPRTAVAVSSPNSFETSLALQRQGLRQYEALSLLEGRSSSALGRHRIDTYA